MPRKYIKVGGVLYVLADDVNDDIKWKARARAAYKVLLELWLEDGRTSKVRRDMNSTPTKLREVFSDYIGNLLEAHKDIINWEEVYNDLHSKDE